MENERHKWLDFGSQAEPADEAVKEQAARVSADKNAGQGQEAGTARPAVLFWSFPAGRGAAQPWRGRLWEYRSSKL